MNIPDIYPEDHTVDQTSYCILLRIREGDGHLWKRELTRRLNDWRQGGLCPLNIDEPVNVQTMSRKVDALVEEGLLEGVVVYPEGLERYVESFELTEEGERVIEDVSRRMEEELLARYAERCARSKELEIDEGVIERLSDNDAVGIEADTSEKLEEELCDRLDMSTGDRLAVTG